MSITIKRPLVGILALTFISVCSALERKEAARLTTMKKVLTRETLKKTDQLHKKIEIFLNRELKLRGFGRVSTSGLETRR